jgi:PIN domain nuclease of toxin-antitoxin system
LTPRLLLDTHIVLWLDSGDAHLRPETRATLETCWRAGGTLLVSAVTAWEIALLSDLRRIKLDLPAADWIERFLGRPGVEAVPLSWRATCGAYGLKDLEHRDPADRMLIATAIELKCPLVSYDKRITEFALAFGAQYRFSLSGPVTDRF